LKGKYFYTKIDKLASQNANAVLPNAIKAQTGKGCYAITHLPRYDAVAVVFKLAEYSKLKVSSTSEAKESLGTATRPGATGLERLTQQAASSSYERCHRFQPMNGRMKIYMSGRIPVSKEANERTSLGLLAKCMQG